MFRALMEEAVALTRRLQPDVVLMDISMPEIDGLEACRRIKAAPEVQDIPIIMVTSSTVAEDLQQAFSAGAMDYITKPPLKAELLVQSSVA